MVEVLLRFKPNMLIAAHDGMFFFVCDVFVFIPSFKISSIDTYLLIS